MISDKRRQQLLNIFDIVNMQSVGLTADEQAEVESIWENNGISYIEAFFKWLDKNDSNPLSAIEANCQLHERLYGVYVVDGYRVSIEHESSERTLSLAKGSTLMEALVKLNTELINNPIK
jgi:hypothetical protein